MDKIVINGHFKQQAVTGVQRYAYEIIRQFKYNQWPFRYVEPPASLSSDILRQLWMQGGMPFQLGSDELLWSPTNIGPIAHQNQVITLHDIADQLHPEWFDAKFVQWRSLVLPPLLKRVKGIITVSEYSKQTIVEQFPYTRDKIEVIYNGVRTDHFYSRPEEEIDVVLAKYKLQKPYVITVGSLDPRKNINGLIAAWNRLPERIRKEMELIIVGGGATKFAFQIEEETDDSIRFLGYVPDKDLPALYSAATIFVYPSLFEGFGLPVLEAMACRTPVITSNTTSLKELAKGYAMTINPAEPEAIATALTGLLNSKELQNELSEKGYLYVENFQWSRTADKTYDFLRLIRKKS
jgi:glycosyltransferase involved in cell wall biosynthesis